MCAVWTVFRVRLNFDGICATKRRIVASVSAAVLSQSGFVYLLFWFAFPLALFFHSSFFYCTDVCTCNGSSTKNDVHYTSLVDRLLFLLFVCLFIFIFFFYCRCCCCRLMVLLLLLFFLYLYKILYLIFPFNFTVASTIWKNTAHSHARPHFCIWLLSYFLTYTILCFVCWWNMTMLTLTRENIKFQFSKCNYFAMDFSGLPLGPAATTATAAARRLFDVCKRQKRFQTEVFCVMTSRH